MIVFCRQEDFRLPDYQPKRSLLQEIETQENMPV